MASSESQLKELFVELELSRRLDQLKAIYDMPFEDGRIGGPYGWQVKFHAAGKDTTERAIIAANQTGKTRTAAAEVALHTTGDYPPWWPGRRFTHGNDWIVAGMTNEDIRDIQQLALVGKIDENKEPDGTGWLPKAKIIDFGFRQCGVPNVLDTVTIQHSSGEKSVITFKSYEQKAVKFQGRIVDGAWCDEEPDDFGIWSELQTRILVKKGMLMFTNTPLKGMSAIIRHFLDGGPGTFYVSVAWEDAPHISPERRDEWMARYPEHERDTRTKGIPMMGTGLVYPIPDDMILCTSFPLPDYYRRVCGVDFGIDHPGAAAWLAHDGDRDILYLYDCYKERGKTPAYHAQSIMARGKWIPVSWPHDGMVRDKGSGVPLAHQYRERGVNMLLDPASWDEGFRSAHGGARAQSREAGAGEILERMHTGRFKVFDTPETRQFLEEKRMLHRKDQQIVPVNDDIESAVRYALMGLRFAISDHDTRVQRPSMQDDTYSPFESFSRRREHGFSKA